MGIPVGSPPPMRGKGYTLSILPILHRITPAYAGKRTNECGNSNIYQDHPRLCGEKGGFPHLLNRELGSPPPMRGKAPDAVADTPRSGITPAYAGKSINLLGPQLVFGDHPRLCGEKVKMALII